MMVSVVVVRGDRGDICNRLLVRLLLPIQTLQRGRTDRHQRALPQLHVSQPDAHVLPKVSILPPTIRSCHHVVTCSRVCPFIKPVGKNCVVEKQEDQCCPTISCPPGQSKYTAVCVTHDPACSES